MAKTCPACGQAFKLRKQDRCPHCNTLLFVGVELRRICLTGTSGYWWDGVVWIPLRQLVGPAVRAR